MSQDFYVVRDFNRNLMLGLDWLKEHNVRLNYLFKMPMNKRETLYYFRRHSCSINCKNEKNLCSYITSQSARICYGKVRNNPDLPSE